MTLDDSVKLLKSIQVQITKAYADLVKWDKRMIGDSGAAAIAKKMLDSKQVELDRIYELYELFQSVESNQLIKYLHIASRSNNSKMIPLGVHGGEEFAICKKGLFSQGNHESRLSKLNSVNLYWQPETISAIMSIQENASVKFRISNDAATKRLLRIVRLVKQMRTIENKETYGNGYEEQITKQVVVEFSKDAPEIKLANKLCFNRGTLEIGDHDVESPVMKWLLIQVEDEFGPFVDRALAHYEVQYAKRQKIINKINKLVEFELMMEQL